MIEFYFECLFCLIFTIMLYLRYADKNVSIITAILVIVNWYMTFLFVAIVPYDIYLVFMFII